MARTEVRQETWWMRFEEEYGGWQERRLTLRGPRLVDAL